MSEQQLRGQKEFEAQYMQDGVLRSNIPTGEIKVSARLHGLQIYFRKTNDRCWISQCSTDFGRFRASDCISDFTHKAISFMEPQLPPGTYEFLMTRENRDTSNQLRERGREVLWRDGDIADWKILPVRVVSVREESKYMGIMACFKTLWADNDFFITNEGIGVKPGDTHGLKVAVLNYHAQGYRGAVVDVNGREFLFPAVAEETWEITGFVEDKKRAHHVGGVVVTNPAYPDLKQEIRKGVNLADGSDMFHNPDRYLNKKCIVQHEGLTSKGTLKHPRVKYFHVEVW